MYMQDLNWFCHHSKIANDEVEIISLLHAGNSTLDSWTVLMNQEIKMFPPHTPRHTAISILLYLHVDVRGFFFSPRKEIQI